VKRILFFLLFKKDETLVEEKDLEKRNYFNKLLIIFKSTIGKYF
jgi:hypothetical protein